MPEMFRSSRAETLIGGVCRSGQSLQLGRHTMCMAGFHAHSFFFKNDICMSMCEMAMVIGLGCGRRTVDLRTVRNSM